MQQTQKLIMTPELKQAIEILQFSALELNDFVSEELLTNPVLERTDDASAEMAAESSQAEFSQAESAGDLLLTPDALDRFPGTLHPDDVLRMMQVEPPSMPDMLIDPDAEFDFPEPVVETDLQTHLSEQLAYIDLHPRYEPAMRFLVESLDASGYLRCTAEDLALRFLLTADEAETLIALLQSLDPVGVGARDLQECLLIQLDAAGLGDSLASALVRHHLDDLAENRIAAIARTLSVPPPEVQAAFDRIRMLHPRPGIHFADARPTRYITPDVTIERDNGETIILVNESSAPRLMISGYYRDLLRRAETDKTTTEYITKKLQAALKLIKAIEQRRSTIYKVCASILQHQADFFERGVEHLKPLTLREVAEDIEMHESTVSRAVSGKYMQCASGIYELRYFFQSGVTNKDGDGVSARSIKTQIRALVDAEDPRHPLSDQDIAAELTARGINISRRTVAKYRDDVGIPASSRRRRF